MTAKTNAYRRLDLNKLSFANKTISMSEALKNIAPTTSDSIIKITKAEKDYESKCVKLEISY